MILKRSLQDGSNREAFVHYSAIQAKGYKKLAEGDIVELDVEKGSKGLKASTVLVIEHASVTARLVDGQGHVQKTAYLHFELWNCGTNVPQVTGSNAIVAQQFDMRADRSGWSRSTRPATRKAAGVIFWCPEQCPEAAE